MEKQNRDWLGFFYHLFILFRNALVLLVFVVITSFFTPFWIWSNYWIFESDLEKQIQQDYPKAYNIQVERRRIFFSKAKVWLDEPYKDPDEEETMSFYVRTNLLDRISKKDYNLIAR